MTRRFNDTEATARRAGIKAAHDGADASDNPHEGRIGRAWLEGLNSVRRRAARPARYGEAWA